MLDDGLIKFEAAMGALSKIDVGENDDLSDARCPKCDNNTFVKISDLYTQAVIRVESGQSDPTATHEGGLTDQRIIERFRPPRKGSAVPIALLFAIPLAAGAVYIYKKFGDLPGQGAGIVSVIILTIVFMTNLRKHSDRHYFARRRWNRTYICVKCGQLILPTGANS